MNAIGHPQQGTIPPGTTIQLGRFTVVIDRYIAEGGFAHVYLANLGGLAVVVKRIAVADKERLAIVNSEIETMKRLGRHKNIVEYMDSTMGKLEGGGYEVLILMEYCGGGPVIDLMNRRLQHRLTEPEILKIFSNVCEAVAYMHYSDPPILHRDIKVENILLSNNDYKLCDFGSATTNILRGDNIPKNVKDIQLLEEEINNHTTLQYRAPEMLDLYMRRGIDEKIDIWALGVLLYKLCYYTTPFEEQGQLAILNARYTIPDHPVFTQGLMNLFKSMLQEDAKQRPNIYQVMQVTSTMRGLPCPIQNKYKDIYIPPPQPTQASTTSDIFSKTVVTRPMDALPSIEPMRRGRPTRAQAAPTPPPAAANVEPEVSQVPSKAPAAADFSSGFDDSFGQFAPADPSSQFSKIGALDPSAQFSKIPPTGDLFDFGSSFKSSTPAPTNNSGKDAKKMLSNSSTGFSQFSTPLAVDGFDLLKQQQMEQLDKFAVKPVVAPIGVPISQGKATILDPSKTLDGLRSMDSGSRTGSSSGSGGNGYVSTPPLAARPNVASQVSASSNYRVATPELAPLDRKELAQKDMEAEMKLIQLQQKAFEQQQQELLNLQRTQLEEQQRLHREQQEKLQKQQQHQIQQQHEKWQERKRMMKEQELLSQKQLSQQQDLVQQHQSQQKLQQRQQQSVQLHQSSSPSSSPSQLPAISNLAASMASASLGDTAVNAQQNPYGRSVSGTSVQQSTGMVYPMASGSSSTHSADPLASLTSQYMHQSRPSLDNLRANFSGQSSSIASSPAPSFNSFTTNTSDSGSTPLLPSAPIKSARRAVDSGVVSATHSNASSSSQPPASPVAASAATRTRHRASIPPPGQKPELLPKPTRFRMKDGAASLAAGEEEAFRRKFPSADIDDEILSLTLTGNTASPLSSSSLSRENGISGRDSPSFATSNSHINSNSSNLYRLQQGRESPTFDRGVKTVNGNGHNLPASTDYRTPSQRARDLRDAEFGRIGSGREDDDDLEEDEEEEEEKLVRRPRPSANNPTLTPRRPLDPQPSQQQQQPASPLAEDSFRSRATVNGSSPIKSPTRPSQMQASTRQENNTSPGGVDDSTSTESVRERIQRMNRIGRVA